MLPLNQSTFHKLRSSISNGMQSSISKDVKKIAEGQTRSNDLPASGHGSYHSTRVHFIHLGAQYDIKCISKDEKRRPKVRLDPTTFQLQGKHVTTQPEHIL